MFTINTNRNLYRFRFAVRTGWLFMITVAGMAIIAPHNITVLAFGSQLLLSTFILRTTFLLLRNNLFVTLHNSKQSTWNHFGI